jgi:hypothetical protein
MEMVNPADARVHPSFMGPDHDMRREYPAPMERKYYAGGGAR